MRPLEHTSALGWIIALSATGWVIAGLMVVLSLNSRGGALPLALGAAGFCLAILVPSVVGAIVLHGVKQMLEQMRAVADEPTVAPQQDGSARP